jgi:hypothetical protein
MLGFFHLLAAIASGKTGKLAQFECDSLVNPLGKTA